MEQELQKLPNEEAKYTVTEKFIFRLLDDLIAVHNYCQFMESCVFMIKSAYHDHKIEANFHDWARINNDSNNFWCDDNILNHENCLDVEKKIKGLVNVLGEEGYLKYCLYRTSKEAIGALPDYSKF